MSQRVSITVRLESFEGPLDLLLYLIQSHELDISKISITKITDQYLAYIRLMQELNFDMASEFLVMAATLLQWKSRALLPQETSANGGMGGAEEETLTQEQLIRQLLEHQRFLEAGQRLAELPRLGEDVFTRANSKPPVERVWKTMEMTALALCYQDLLVRARKRTSILKKETVSLTDKIMEFADRIPLNKLIELHHLLSELPTRSEIVVTFLAALELSRLKKMRVHQEKAYAEIYLELLESLKGFDIHLASGFDNIEQTVSAPQAAPASAFVSEALSPQ